MAGCVCGHWTETVSAHPRFALDHYHETISHLQTEVPGRIAGLAAVLMAESAVKVDHRFSLGPSRPYTLRLPR